MMLSFKQRSMQIFLKALIIQREKLCPKESQDFLEHCSDAIHICTFNGSTCGCSAQLEHVSCCEQVRLASVAENSFNAVERISEFCDLPQEAPEEIRYTKPDGWPDKGRVRLATCSQKLSKPLEAVCGSVHHHQCAKRLTQSSRRVAWTRLKLKPVFLQKRWKLTE